MGVVRAASGAQALQDQGVDGSGVGVALVDSGAMPVEGLDAGQIVDGPDFSADGGNPDLAGLDAFGHGTHLAGIIAGRDGDGFTGVAPGAHVVDVKVADADGSTSLLRVLEALDWVRRHAGDDRLDIRVVNLALGVDAGDTGYVRDPLAYAVEQLWKSGLVVVAAAGNGGPDTTSLDIPAADPYVIAVGADDTHNTAGTRDDRVASFSARSWQRPPDVIAPGTEVISLRVPGSVLDTAFPAARVGDRYFRGSGTSQATAVVSGVAALLLEQRPDLAPDQVKALLEDGASIVDAPGGGAPLPIKPERKGRGHGRGHGRDVVVSDPGTATTDPVEAAEGAGLVNGGRSAALPAPGLPDVTQTWPPAVDTGVFDQRGGPMHAGDTRWAGRRWSGRTWSGRTWSGRTWSGRSWSAANWDGDAGAP
jgi:serine protease AprX